MKNEVLFVLLNDYADYEPAYISGSINCDKFGMKQNPKYVTKVVAPTMDLVRSCGGFHTMPDYSFDNLPEDYAALILIGGFGWTTDEAKRVAPIVKDAISKGIIVGGICNGASFLAQNGFLNNVKHTGNGLEELKRWGGDNYTNATGYQNVQAESDNGIVTAIIAHKNGTCADIDLWIMSCRTFKRNLEHAMFDRLVEICAQQGITTINGSYLPTAKNLLVADFYATIGFEKTAENQDGSKQFAFTAFDGYKPQCTVMETVIL